MKVGITYDLRDEYLREGYSEEETAEFDREDTIEAIEQALRCLGFETKRIGHAKKLMECLLKGYRGDIVFNIAEGLNGIGREAQVPAILDIYGIPYTFSDPLVLSLTLHKAMTKRIVRDMGVATADFALIENERDLDSISIPFPLFAKPVAEGTGKGIDAGSKVNNSNELRTLCLKLLKNYNQSVLVETFLPGREFTVAILGTGDDARALGVLEILLNKGAEREVYSYVNKERCEELVTYKLVHDRAAKLVAEIALKVWKGLGCRDAGRVDIKADGEELPHFIEVNPLAGLHPYHSDLPILCSMIGMSYRELIGNIMDSALGRIRSASDILHKSAL